jgi:D-alanyl-D-alanine carboxypeptidase
VRALLQRPGVPVDSSVLVLQRDGQVHPAAAARSRPLPERVVHQIDEDVEDLPEYPHE